MSLFKVIPFVISRHSPVKAFPTYLHHALICLITNNTNYHRWAPRSCIEARHFICQTKLLKMPKAKVKTFNRRWQRQGEINEINVPAISREVNDPMMVNDVTANPVHNPKSYDLRPNQPRLGPKRHGPRPNSIRGTRNYDLRPNELKKRQRPSIRRRLKRPFPG